MIIRNYLFHRVSPGKEQWSLPMTPDRFEKCVKIIKRNCEVRSVEELLEDDDLRKFRAKPLASLSFDDGFKDNLEYAAPILQKHKCQASFYIVTESVENNILNWSHIYLKVFQETKKLTLNIETASNGVGKINRKFTSKKERIAFGRQLFQQLKTIPFEATEKILAELFSYYDDVHQPKGYMMNWKEVNELKNNGFVIGAHTKTHPFLATIGLQKNLELELSEPMVQIKAKCGHQPLTISYPFGSYNQNVMKTAREVGYQYGLIVGQRFLHTETEFDTMEVPRVDLYADSGWTKTYLRISGHLEKVKSIFK